MSQKTPSTKELNPSVDALSLVDFKSGHAIYGKGFLCFADLPRVAAEILARYPDDDVRSSGVFWELRTWFADAPVGDAQQRLQVMLQVAYPLDCQRCMQRYVENLDITSQFLFKNTAAEVDDFPLDNDVEDALLMSHEFNCIEFFEDEILLHLPLIPKHPTDACGFITFQADKAQAVLHRENAGKDTQMAVINPFESLKKVKFNA